MLKTLFFFVAVLCCCNLMKAQNVFNPNDGITIYNSNAPKGSSTNPNLPANGVMSKWVKTTRVGWTTTKFKCYMWNGMAFRMRFPNNYSAANATKYPVIVFYHGGGEIAPVYDNEDQLVWAAQLFEQRINNGEWNGFLIFPQETYVGWDLSYFSRVTSVLDTLQKYNNSDVDRVIAMGLSSGGFGAIAYADFFSSRVAAALASSPAQVGALTNDIPGYFQNPLWIANGGNDLNPDPATVQNYYSAFRNSGGNIYRSYYVNDSHNTWTDMWNQKNAAGTFITTTYWNNAHKAQPVLFFQNSQFCSDGPIAARMAVSPGFNTYEWQLNNATIAGATGNEYTATQAGTYRVRFKRDATSAFSAWTPNPIVISTKSCAVDTLYAEHFSKDNPYVSAPEYSMGNFSCQGGILTSGTDLFTQDATGTQGNRFLVNYTKGGSGCSMASGDRVWKTYNPFTVKPNTSYEYSFYIGNQNSTSLAQLAPAINGTALIAGYIQATGTGNASWKKYTYTWNSGAATTADLSIINRNTASSGNDFVIDEIAFRPVPIPVTTCTTNTSPATGAVLATSSTATLTWSAATNATSYAVYLWTGATAPVSPTAIVTTTTYNASGLTPSSQYKWYVTPRNANDIPATGCSANQTTFTTAAAAPACITNTAPANGATLATTTTAALTWNTASGATSYDVYLWTGATAPVTATANTTVASYNATALTPSSVYKWYIVPKNAAGAATGCSTNFTSFTTAALPTAPSCVTNTAPANGVTISTNTAASLSWPAAATATSYDVYLWTGATAPVTATANVTTTSYSATGLIASTVYSWYIVPKNAVGPATGCSANKTTFTTAVAPLTPPACVTNTTPANGATVAANTAVTLTWPTAATATSYDVYLWTGATAPTTATATVTAATYTVSGLASSSTYSWYIVPRNSAGAATGCNANATTFSIAAGVTLPACVTNTLPANGATLPSQTSARLTWPASAGATSYDVYLATGNAVPTVLAANTTALTYYATGLTAGSLYSWYIAPRNANGGNTACGVTNKTTFITAAATGGANQPPVANAGTDFSITLPVSTVTLDGTASYDPDGSVVEYYWFQGQGPVTTTMGNFTPTPTVTGLTTAGTYIFVLQAKDNNGVPSYAQVTVIVNASGARVAVTGAQQTLRSTLPDAAAAAQVTNRIALAPGVYPNPIAAGQNTTLQVHSVNGGIATVQVVGATGSVMQTEKLNLAPGANTRIVHTAGLRPGLYIVHLNGSAGKNSVFKLIVN